MKIMADTNGLVGAVGQEDPEQARAACERLTLK